jgi:hypothetical protein
MIRTAAWFSTPLFYLDATKKNSLRPGVFDAAHSWPQDISKAGQWAIYKADAFSFPKLAVGKNHRQRNTLDWIRRYSRSQRGQKNSCSTGMKNNRARLQRK